MALYQVPYTFTFLPLCDHLNKQRARKYVFIHHEPESSCVRACVCVRVLWLQEQMTTEQQTDENYRLQDQFTLLLRDVETYLQPIAAELDVVLRFHRHCC